MRDECTLVVMADPRSTTLSPAQLETLSDHGDARTAETGEYLFKVGDETYPLIAILEGEAAVEDPSGNEIIRHGVSGFLGEMSLLTGQTVFLSARATQPMRYIAVERTVMRQLMTEDSTLADTLLASFMQRRESLQAREGIGIEIVGPRAHEGTKSLLEWARRARLAFTWLDPESDAGARGLVEALAPDDLPLVRLPGGAELKGPTSGELSRALGIGLELKKEEECDLLIVGGGPAGLGAAVYGASEGLDTLVVERTILGGQAGMSRRIENYLGFPAGISGGELTSRAVTQARKFAARTATPYRALSLEPGPERHVVKLDSGVEVSARAVVLATGADYRRLPVDDLSDYEGLSVFYAAGPPEAQLCSARRVGVIGGGNSAAQAAIWLARGGALVTLLHRRADLTDTMSHYLISDLKRYGVPVRDRSEISELHGSDGELHGVTLTDGTRLELSFLFLFLGATPCTDWLGDVVARDESGFILTGEAAGMPGLLETSVERVYAAGDARSGSIKRCATAVGEGATAIQLVHKGLG